ncbi:MAG: hypothetical protein ACSHYB_19365 [Roseibacillus sp.]
MGSKLLLVASHLLVFTLCLLLGKSLANTSPRTSTAPKNPTSGNPHPPLHSPRETLSRFLPQATDSYKELAQSIAPSTDFASQLSKLLKQVKLPRVYNDDDVSGDSVEEIALFNQIHAHVYQWLQTDPEAFFQFLQKDSDYRHILSKGPTNALLDHIAETGVLNNLELIRSMGGSHNSHFLSKSLQSEFEKGARLSLLDRLETEIVGFPSKEQGQSDLIAAFVSFDQREDLLSRVLDAERPNIYEIVRFIRNKEHPQAEIIPWVQGLLASDRLSEEMKEGLRPNFRYWLERYASQIPPDERVALTVAETGGNPKQVAKSVAQNEVFSFLNDSDLDYRYQFRHGRLSAQEIGALFQKQYPDLLTQNPVDSVRRLYVELSEEGPTGALPILDLLNDPIRATNIQYYAFTRGFFNVSPDQILEQSESLPPPAGPGQEKARYQAWKLHSDDLLKRHGNDYVQWVTEMTPGPQKEAAIHWTSQYAEELFPKQAEEISSQLNFSRNQ